MILPAARTAQPLPATGIWRVAYGAWYVRSAAPAAAAALPLLPLLP